MLSFLVALIPFVVIGGGVWYVKNARKKAQENRPQPAPAAPAASATTHVADEEPAPLPPAASPASAAPTPFAVNTVTILAAPPMDLRHPEARQVGAMHLQVVNDGLHAMLDVIERTRHRLDTVQTYIDPTNPDASPLMTAQERARRWMDELSNAMKLVGQTNHDQRLRLSTAQPTATTPAPPSPAD